MSRVESQSDWSDHYADDAPQKWKEQRWMESKCDLTLSSSLRGSAEQCPENGARDARVSAEDTSPSGSHCSSVQSAPRHSARPTRRFLHDGEHFAAGGSVVAEVSRAGEEYLHLDCYLPSEGDECDSSDAGGMSDGKGTKQATQEDDGEDGETDFEECTVPVKSCPRGFAPPTPYLPLPSLPTGATKFEACTSDSAQESGSRAKVLYKGLTSRHLLLRCIQPALLESMMAHDSIRKAVNCMYKALPLSNSGPPILARLRRRLIRLAAHATLSHHRGRHEVIFQTSFLFDLVLLKYADWLENNCDKKADSSFSGFLFSKLDKHHGVKSLENSPQGSTDSSASSCGLDGPQCRIDQKLRDADRCEMFKNHFDPASLSRLTTSATLSGKYQSGIEVLSKEDLRTLIIATLLLASKWNNSRYLPPAALCSAPVGRVPLQAVLKMEIALLCLFDFDIPFPHSMVSQMMLVFGCTEETEPIPHILRLTLDLSLMILELAIADYNSLAFKGETLVQSAVWLGKRLCEAGSGMSALTDWRPSLQVIASAEWSECLRFHLQNVEFEMRSAIGALQRLRSLGRWPNQREAPNVFGANISSRMTNCVPVSSSGSGDVEGKTKTESIALEFLRGPSSAAFDILVAATQADGYRQPHRSGFIVPRTFHLDFTKVRSLWMRICRDYETAMMP